MNTFVRSENGAKRRESEIASQTSIMCVYVYVVYNVCL